MVSKEIKVHTNSRSELLNISSLLEDFLATNNIKDGICHIYIPHTTCGVTINENADPDVKRDILMELEKTIPFSDGYLHMEGNSAAHIKASMMGFSASIPVLGGRPATGVWQDLYLCEFDGPRTRKVRFSFIQ